MLAAAAVLPSITAAGNSGKPPREVSPRQPVKKSWQENEEEKTFLKNAVSPIYDLSRPKVLISLLSLHHNSLLGVRDSSSMPLADCHYYHPLISLLSCRPNPIFIDTLNTLKLHNCTVIGISKFAI